MTFNQVCSSINVEEEKKIARLCCNNFIICCIKSLTIIIPRKIISIYEIDIQILINIGKLSIRSDAV